MKKFCTLVVRRKDQGGHGEYIIFAKVKRGKEKYSFALCKINNLFLSVISVTFSVFSVVKHYFYGFQSSGIRND